MNKTYFVAGGVAIASLAAGGAGGYFFAKKKFEAQLDSLIEAEVEKTKKYYSVQIMELKNSKPETPEQAVEQRRQKEVYDLSDGTNAEKERVSGKGKLAQEALTNYQGISTNGAIKADEHAVEQNIFKDRDKKPKLPPRGPGGKFLPADKAAPSSDPTDGPYIISADEFLDNDPGHDQENYKFFVRDNTLIRVYDMEAIDIEEVNETNLSVFPDVPEGQESIVCVRNDALGKDYEIHLDNGSLTEAMGFGESEEDESRYV